MSRAVRGVRGIQALWSGVNAGWGCGLLLVALACGEASEPGPIGAAGTSTGGAGAGDAGTAGTAGMGTGGTTLDLPPPSAPACSTESQPFFMSIAVDGIDDPMGRDVHTTRRARVVARGVGLPEGRTQLPRDATSAEQVGWLRLVDLDSLPGSDAGVVDADAGTTDAGSADAGSADADSAGTPLVIVGPREVSELPVEIGASVTLTVNHVSSGYGDRGRVRYGSRSVALREADEVLLLLHGGSVGSAAGFSFAAGDAVCATRVPMDRPCVDATTYALDVSVPGGATATLAPQTAQTLGAYRVFHSATWGNVPLWDESSCDDGRQEGTHTGVTAVRLPASP